MDFLTSALYTSAPTTSFGENDGALSGVVITRFNPEDITSRPQVVFKTVEQLRSDSSINPWGFKLDSDGVLLSDTMVRRVMNSMLTEYVVDEVGRTKENSEGLIDIVLRGVACDAIIIQNYEEMLDAAASPIVVDMLDLKVSNSSFNIYAPYKNSEDKFRTMSLVDISTNTAESFVMAVPKDKEASFNASRSPYLYQLPHHDAFEDHVLFRVTAPLKAFHVLTGEAFCNFLAYNVAYYKLGLTIIKQFMTENNYASTEVTGTAEARRPAKVPLSNVSIVSNYKTSYVTTILNLLNENRVDEFRELISVNEEARISSNWLHEVSMVDSSGYMRLLMECKKQLLRYSLELLSHRLYIDRLGQFEDPLGLVLRGGGVNGSAIKRVTR